MKHLVTLLALGFLTINGSIALAQDSLPIETVAWSPDGTKIALGGGPECDANDPSKFSIYILDAATHQVLQSLPGHICRLTSVAWSPDGTKLASSSVDGTARVWNAITGQVISVAELTTLGRGELAWSPDGTKIANIWLQDFRFEIWDAATGQSLKVFEVSAHPMTSVDWSPDGAKLISSGGNDNSIRIWEYSTGQALSSLTGHTGVVRHVRWSPDGMKLASGGSDNTIRIWDATTGQLLQVIQTDAQDIRWHPSSQSIGVAVYTDNTVRVWDTTTGQELSVVQSAIGRVNSIDWNPSGTQLVYVGSNTGVQGENLQIIPVPAIPTPTATPTPTPTLTPTPHSRATANVAELVLPKLSGWNGGSRVF